MFSYGTRMRRPALRRWRGAGHCTGAPPTDPKNDPAPLCSVVLIHEFAYIVDYAYRLEPGGQEFHSRIKNGYRVAVRAGLRRGHYASGSDNEYWAEMFRFLGQARFATV